MLFIAISIAVPVVLWSTLPVVIGKFNRKTAQFKSLLTVACLLFLISWYLPSPYIQGEQTAFMTHFVGGGFFSAFLWLYLRKQFTKDFNIFYDLVGMYTLSTALGVANELFELLITQAEIVNITPADTWWDLLANTLGVLFIWIFYAIYKAFRKPKF